MKRIIIEQKKSDYEI